MDSIVAVQNHESTRDAKRGPILSCAWFFHDTGQHGQTEHHGGDGHVAAGPGFESVIAPRQIRYYLPSISSTKPMAMPSIKTIFFLLVEFFLLLVQRIKESHGGYRRAHEQKSEGVPANHMRP